MKRLDFPATGRNRAPILEVLRATLAPRRGDPLRVLEIGCGSGQHAVHLALHLELDHPGLTWLPSDPDPSHRASADAWAEHEGIPHIAPALDLDAASPTWTGALEAPPDVIYCANVIHIAPWSVAEGLVAGAGRLLAPGGLLVLYGPFLLDGAHTAPSNERFDASLRSRDPSWGVRDLAAITSLAWAAGLRLEARHEMPANNQAVVFARP